MNEIVWKEEGSHWRGNFEGGTVCVFLRERGWWFRFSGWRPIGKCHTPVEAMRAAEAWLTKPTD